VNFRRNCLYVHEEYGQAKVLANVLCSSSPLVTHHLDRFCSFPCWETLLVGTGTAVRGRCCLWYVDPRVLRIVSPTKLHRAICGSPDPRRSVWSKRKIWCTSHTKAVWQLRLGGCKAQFRYTFCRLSSCCTCFAAFPSPRVEITHLVALRPWEEHYYEMRLEKCSGTMAN